MRLQEFKKLVQAEFGKDLRHATPANVREFLDKFQQEVFKNRITDGEGRIEINETAETYEEIIKDFFTRILDAPSEDAIIALWTLALDLSFAAIEYQYEDRLGNMFRDLEE